MIPIADIAHSTTESGPYGGAASGETGAWTAVLAFRYTDATMNMGDRFFNPLGFQVVRYRRDADTASGTSAPVPITNATGLR